MNWTESKIDMVLKMAICLAIIGSVVGCNDGNSSSFGSSTTLTLSITSADWTYPGNYVSLPVYQGSATPGLGSHADHRPSAQSVNAHTRVRILRGLMNGNKQDG
jgi:hypothetical protein